MRKIIKLKQDRFQKARGGHARIVEISCKRCNAFVALYQKDGSGLLKRMYVDRIIKFGDVAGKNLFCSACKSVLGVRYMYKKEKRVSFRLFAGAVAKKVVRVRKVSASAHKLHY